MTYEEYKRQEAEIDLNAKMQKNLLMAEFVKANNPYKIGDIVTDHIGSIIIDKIQSAWGYGGTPPSAVYGGLVLKKDGTPTKKMERRSVFQGNIKKKD